MQADHFAIQRAILNEIVGDALLDAVGDSELTAKRILAGNDHTETLARIGMKIADLTTQHYVHGGVDKFHAKMAELEAEHDRISKLPAEKPKVRRVGTGKSFRQWWTEPSRLGGGRGGVRIWRGLRAVAWRGFGVPGWRGGVGWVRAARDAGSTVGCEPVTEPGAGS